MTQTASIFLRLSVDLLAGLLLSRLAKKVQLPAVTAYLVAGVLIGPFLTKVALTKAGDINEEGRKSARDEHLLNKQKQETQQ